MHSLEPGKEEALATIWAAELIDAEQLCGKGPVSLGKIQSQALHSGAWWEDERQGT